MIKNTCGLENVKDKYMKRENEALIKMYPAEDTENKYILFVESELWFPYLSEGIKANIDFIYEDGIKHYKNKLRKPYANKTIMVVSMVNGRKACDLGIPILFNSYEELKKLKSILVKWKIDSISSKDEKEKFYIQVLYDLNFKFEEGKRVYSLFSKDTLPQCYDDKALEKKYFDEFSKIICIAKFHRDDISCGVIKKDNKDEWAMEEKWEDECFTTIMENVGVKEFVEDNKDDKNFLIFSYYADETLLPNVIAENIPHY